MESNDSTLRVDDSILRMDITHLLSAQKNKDDIKTSQVTGRQNT